MNSVDSNLTDQLPTRMSLLSRLRNLDDDRSWRDFHERYGQLISDVVRRSGVQKTDVDEIVQETLIVVAGCMPGFRYDPARGSFKSWLRTITRNRVADHFRRVYRMPEIAVETPETPLSMPDDRTSQAFDDAWEDEWKRHLLSRALTCLGSKITPRDRQVFDLAVVNGWSLDDVRKATGLSRTHIYVIRHRVGRLIKGEIARLSKELET